MHWRQDSSNIIWCDFTGLYYDVGFEFDVYVTAKRHLNPKTRQNPVWRKPVTPPERLKDALDNVRYSTDKKCWWIEKVTITQGSLDCSCSDRASNKITYCSIRTFNVNSKKLKYMPILDAVKVSAPLNHESIAFRLRVHDKIIVNINHEKCISFTWDERAVIKFTGSKSSLIVAS